MAIQLSKIRLVEIDGQIIVAPRELSVAGVKKWFERSEGLEAITTKVIGLTDKIAETRKTYASAIEAVNCDTSDLPIFL